MHAFDVSFIIMRGRGTKRLIHLVLLLLLSADYVVVDGVTRTDSPITAGLRKKHQHNGPKHTVVSGRRRKKSKERSEKKKSNDKALHKRNGVTSMKTTRLQSGYGSDSRDGSSQRPRLHGKNGSPQNTGGNFWDNLFSAFLDDPPDLRTTDAPTTAPTTPRLSRVKNEDTFFAMILSWLFSFWGGPQSSNVVDNPPTPLPSTSSIARTVEDDREKESVFSILFSTLFGGASPVSNDGVVRPDSVISPWPYPTTTHTTWRSPAPVPLDPVPDEEQYTVQDSLLQVPFAWLRQPATPTPLSGTWLNVAATPSPTATPFLFRSWTSWSATLQPATPAPVSLPAISSSIRTTTLLPTPASAQAVLVSMWIFMDGTAMEKTRVMASDEVDTACVRFLEDAIGDDEELSLYKDWSCHVMDQRIEGVDTPMLHAHLHVSSLSMGTDDALFSQRVMRAFQTRGAEFVQQLEQTSPLCDPAQTILSFYVETVVGLQDESTSEARTNDFRRNPSSSPSTTEPTGEPSLATFNPTSFTSPEPEAMRMFLTQLQSIAQGVADFLISAFVWLRSLRPSSTATRSGSPTAPSLAPIKTTAIPSLLPTIAGVPTVPKATERQGSHATVVGVTDSLVPTGEPLIASASPSKTTVFLVEQETSAPSEEISVSFVPSSGEPSRLVSSSPTIEPTHGLFRPSMEPSRNYATAPIRPADGSLLPPHVLSTTQTSMPSSISPIEGTVLLSSVLLPLYTRVESMPPSIGPTDNTLDPFSMPSQLSTGKDSVLPSIGRSESSAWTTSSAPSAIPTGQASAPSMISTLEPTNDYSLDHTNGHNMQPSTTAVDVSLSRLDSISGALSTEPPSVNPEPITPSPLPTEHIAHITVTPSVMAQSSLPTLESSLSGLSTAMQSPRSSIIEPTSIMASATSPSRSESPPQNLPSSLPPSLVGPEVAPPLRREGNEQISVLYVPAVTAENMSETTHRVAPDSVGDYVDSMSIQQPTWSSSVSRSTPNTADHNITRAGVSMVDANSVRPTSARIGAHSTIPSSTSFIESDGSVAEPTSAGSSDNLRLMSTKPSMSPASGLSGGQSRPLGYPPTLQPSEAWTFPPSLFPHSPMIILQQPQSSASVTSTLPSPIPSTISEMRSLDSPPSVKTTATGRTTSSPLSDFPSLVSASRSFGSTTSSKLSDTASFLSTPPSLGRTTKLTPSDTPSFVSTSPSGVRKTSPLPSDFPSFVLTSPSAAILTTALPSDLPSFVSTSPSAANPTTGTTIPIGLNNFLPASSPSEFSSAIPSSYPSDLPSFASMSPTCWGSSDDKGIMVRGVFIQLQAYACESTTGDAVESPSPLRPGMYLTVCIDGTGDVDILSIDSAQLAGGPNNFQSEVVTNGVAQNSITLVDCTSKMNTCVIQTYIALLDFLNTMSMPIVQLSGTADLVGEESTAKGHFLFMTELESLTQPIATAVEGSWAFDQSLEFLSLSVIVASCLAWW